jgi:hypothetical protein
MGFLRKLFGGQASSSGDADGLYYYVKGDRTGEVVQVRLHRYNDLSETDNQQGFYARKLVVGQDHFERMEAEFFFDKNRRLTSADVQGGSLVDRDDYDAYRAQRAQE